MNSTQKKRRNVYRTKMSCKLWVRSHGKETKRNEMKDALERDLCLIGLIIILRSPRWTLDIGRAYNILKQHLMNVFIVHILFIAFDGQSCFGWHTIAMHCASQRWSRHIIFRLQKKKTKFGHKIHNRIAQCAPNTNDSSVHDVDDEEKEKKKLILSFYAFHSLQQQKECVCVDLRSIERHKFALMLFVLIIFCVIYMEKERTWKKVNSYLQQINKILIFFFFFWFIIFRKYIFRSKIICVAVECIARLLCWHALNKSPFYLFVTRSSQKRTVTYRTDFDGFFGALWTK